MSHISAVVRLRPVRFAFIVRPDDKKHVLQIFQSNTCLWGGKYNPVVPYFKQVPKWWDRNGHNFETAVQIINGYLDFFEPDFLVEAEPGLQTVLVLTRSASCSFPTSSRLRTIARAVTV